MHWRYSRILYDLNLPCYKAKHSISQVVKARGAEGVTIKGLTVYLAESKSPFPKICGPVVIGTLVARATVHILPIQVKLLQFIGKIQIIFGSSHNNLITIVTHKGLYRYHRLQHWVTSVPSLFQWAMEQILCGLLGVQRYLDDSLISGKTKEERLRNLDATLQQFKEFGLGVHTSMCEFFQDWLHSTSEQ